MYQRGVVSDVLVIREDSVEERYLQGNKCAEKEQGNGLRPCIAAMIKYSVEKISSYISQVKKQLSSGAVV